MYIANLCQVSKTNSVLVKAEDGVDVLHKAVTEEPDIISKTEILASERANTVRGTLFSSAKVEAVPFRSVEVQTRVH